jgi:RNA polymerase sigma-70 factor (ECF subfamily)
VIERTPLTEDGAAALAAARGAEPALAVLDALAAAVIASYQPYWALRAHLLAALGRADEASAAYSRAIDLGQDPAVRTFLPTKEATLWRGR